MTTIVNEAKTADRLIPPMNWGAVLAGLVVAISISWLLGLLGSAIGISVADATDLDAVTAGFGAGAAIWLIITFAVAYLLGGIVAGRLSGHADDNVGMLHGLTLWGLATIITACLAAFGATSIVQGGYAVAKGVASGVAATGSELVSAGGAVGGAASDLADTAAFDRIQATVRRNARAALAEGMAAESSELSEQQADAAIRDIDQQVLQDVGAALLEGDIERAESTLAAQTGLSESEIESLIDSAESEIRSAIPGASTDESAVQAAGDYLSQ